MPLLSRLGLAGAQLRGLGLRTQGGGDALQLGLERYEQGRRVLEVALLPGPLQPRSQLSSWARGERADGALDGMRGSLDARRLAGGDRGSELSHARWAVLDEQADQVRHQRSIAAEGAERTALIDRDAGSVPGVGQLVPG